MRDFPPLSSAPTGRRWNEMLEKMCTVMEQVDAASVESFADRYVEQGEMEEQFYEAIRDSKEVGFKEGMRAAFQLFSEVQC